MVFNIAIIGAGPAGTMLARLLTQAPAATRPHVTIYEGEASVNFRSQGGTLDLHEQTGQAALKAGNLFTEFQQHARYDGEALKIADKNFLCYINLGGGTADKPAAGRPEIDRPVLRKMLFDSLPPNTVQWNRKLHHIATDPTTSQHTLHFADGTSASNFDLIVGADGAWSKTRAVLTSVQPYYSGIGWFSLSIPDAANTIPADLFALVNRGSIFAFSDHTLVAPQYMGDGSISVGVCRVMPSDWQKTCGYDVHDEVAVRAALAEQLKDWDPRLVAYTQYATGVPVPRDLCMLPVGIRWDPVPGVTVIGDAAHLVTPFAGEGANIALQDAMKLGAAILAAAGTEEKASRSTLDKHVAAFEQDMFVRARDVQQVTEELMTAMMLTTDAPRRNIHSYVARAVGHGMAWPMQWAVYALSWAYFTIFRMIY